MRVHLDTDFGGDPDDACALAMLLGWPEVEIAGITTTLDVGGRRAGYVAHCLELVGRTDIPLEAGAAVSMTTRLVADPVIDDERHWPASIPCRPSPPGAALDLLSSSIDQGATVIAIGPYTNLALLEIMKPGSLGRVPVAIMGGWTQPPDPGLPQWGAEMDFNVQWDTWAAKIVGESADLIMGALPATLNAHLRAADLPRLRESGPLGALLASQSEAHALAAGMGELGRRHTRLPDDLLNLHYDPLTAAVAVGWEGARFETTRLKPVIENDILRFMPDEAGREAKVLIAIDAEAFREAWITAVEVAQQSSQTG